MNEQRLVARDTNATREGKKDSLSRGDSDNSGQVYRLAPDGLGINNNATVRENTPGVFDIDERKEALEATDVPIPQHNPATTTTTSVIYRDVSGSKWDDIRRPPAYVSLKYGL